jgi:hypothetical protein
MVVVIMAVVMAVVVVTVVRLSLLVGPLEAEIGVGHGQDVDESFAFHSITNSDGLVMSLNVIHSNCMSESVGNAQGFLLDSRRSACATWLPIVGCGWCWSMFDLSAVAIGNLLDVAGH